MACREIYRGGRDSGTVQSGKNKRSDQKKTTQTDTVTLKIRVREAASFWRPQNCFSAKGRSIRQWRA